MKKAKKVSRKPAKKKLSPKKPLRTKVEKPIGVVTHFYTAIKVAIAKFKMPVSVGARLKFKGATTDFEMALVSMQYNHASVKRAKKNQQVGIKVPKRVREGDEIFKA